MTGSLSNAVTPGLVVAVLYLRPAIRLKAVPALVQLGMFVREYETPPSHSAERVDLFAIYASDREADLQFVEGVLGSGCPVVVLLPPGHGHEGFEEKGALVFVEGQDPALLHRSFIRAGRVARQRGWLERDRQIAPSTVFGGLEFHPGHRWLVREGNLATLSPTEYGVLSALVMAGGTLVPKATLQRQVTRNGQPATDGHLKTVVFRLRKKALLLGGDPTRLLALRGAGYALRE